MPSVSLSHNMKSPISFSLSIGGASLKQKLVHQPPQVHHDVGTGSESISLARSGFFMWVMGKTEIFSSFSAAILLSWVVSDSVTYF